jgi:nucleotide-binding universal stress UspA family protein
MKSPGQGDSPTAEAPWRELVVGMDDSDRGEDALLLATRLARATGAPLRLLRFTGSGRGPDHETLVEEVRKAAEPILTGAGVRAAAVEVEPGDPVEGFQHLTATGEGQCVVLGSTHRAGFGKILPGSVADRALPGATCMIAIAPRGLAAGDRDLDRSDLLVLAAGFDGSSESLAALTVAESLALGAGATLRVIAASPDGMTKAARSRLEDQLLEAVRDLPAEIRALPVRPRGIPAEELVEQAEQGVDLLVLGSRREGTLRRLALGTTTGELMRSAPCPLLLVPRPS